MPITERLTLPVQGGVEAWKDALKFMLQTLKKQDGYLRTRWGPHSDNENILELLIGWESKEAQVRFEASADFQEAMAQMKPLISGTPTKHFVQFVPYAPKEIIDAALVQVITIKKASVGEEKLRDQVMEYKDVAGCTGCSCGVSETADKDFIAITGWETLEAAKKGPAEVKIEGGDIDIAYVNFRFPIKGYRGL